ncbi:MAG: 30S ribosome-binding factor RbfA [Holosporaceae bacterium]|jgi:ribosome-binding factor A|nr:30S ribosome-binding factor RbfA [Holosporaceae bacterium]
MINAKKKCRACRVATEIRKVLSEYLLLNPFSDEKINSTFLSITEVTVSPCLRHTKIYVASLLENVSNSDCLEFFNKYAPGMRYHLGKKIRLKFVPDLSFFIDVPFDDIHRKGDCLI